MQTIRGINKETFSKGKWFGFTRLWSQRGTWKDCEGRQIPWAHTENCAVSVHRELIIVRSSKLRYLCRFPSYVQRFVSSLQVSSDGNPPGMSSLSVMCMGVCTFLGISSEREKKKKQAWRLLSIPCDPQVLN